jgi:hypothetical protein
MFPFSRVFEAGSHQLTTTDLNVLCDTSVGSVTIILPKISELLDLVLKQGYSVGANGVFTVNITDISNNASTNNINVVAFAGDYYSGNIPSVVINENSGNVSLKPVYNNFWQVIYGNGVSGSGANNAVILLGSGTGSSYRCGNNNISSGLFSTVSGGCGNSASGYSSTISGGYGNTASNYSSTISGGYGNTASGYSSTIAGGRVNTISNNYGTISGGYNNNISGANSTISGGYTNTISGYLSTIGGGSKNCITECYSTVSGGYQNCVLSTFSTISGGLLNRVSGSQASISGGYSNCAGSTFSFVGGGCGNKAVSTGSAILGGTNNDTTGFVCAMIVGDNIAADRDCTTFVNNLSIKNIPASSVGLPSGSVWKNGTVLEIVP